MPPPDFTVIKKKMITLKVVASGIHNKKDNKAMIYRQKATRGILCRTKYIPVIS